MRTNVTSVNALRRLFARLRGDGVEDTSDRRAGGDRRSGEDRRSSLSVPPIDEERRSGADRRAGDDRRGSS